MDSGPRKLLWIVPVLLIAVMTAVSIAAQHGGILHPEIDFRLPVYLSSRPLPKIIFDSNVMELGMYQARELSYLFDYVDCRFIAACVAFGHPHFFSLTTYVFLALISVTFWRFGTADLKLSPWLVSGALLLFWTTPAVFLGGSFFRTAKIGVGLATVILYRLIFRALRAANENPVWQLPTRAWLACFGWAVIAALFDRQGFFMLVIALGFLMAWERRLWSLIGAFMAAFDFSLLYNYLLAPLATLALNGYWPDFRYQQLPWHNLVAKPGYFTTEGLVCFADAVRFLFGGIPIWAAGIFIAVIIVVICLTRSRGKIALLASQTIFIWAMFVLMLLRANSLAPEVRLTYYVLPTTAMFAMSALLLIAYFKKPLICGVLLAAAIAGNIVALPRHAATLRAGQATAFYATSAEMLDALRHLDQPNPAAARHPIYRYFREQRSNQKNQLSP